MALLRLVQDHRPAALKSAQELDGEWGAALRYALGGAAAKGKTQSPCGGETARSHLKKAQIKLGARNRTQAVAEALRQKLIPEDFCPRPIANCSAMRRS